MSAVVSCVPWLAVAVEFWYFVRSRATISDLRQLAEGVNKERGKIEAELKAPGNPPDQPPQDEGAASVQDADTGTTADSQASRDHVADQVSGNPKPPESALTKMVEGQNAARQRNDRLHKVSSAREGTVLLSETLEAFHMAEVDGVLAAPQTMVLWSLLFTIVGLIIALWALAGIFSGGADPGRMAQHFGLMWRAFVPTAFGLGFSLWLGWDGRQATNEWSKAVEELDKVVIGSITDKRGEGTSPEEAAQKLGAAAVDLGEASGRLSTAVGPFTRSVAQLENAVSKLDTTSVMSSMKDSATAFAEVIRRGAGVVADACKPLEAAAQQLQPGTEKLTKSAGEITSAADSLTRTARDISAVFERLPEQTAAVARALEPAQAAAERLHDGLLELKEAQGRMSASGASIERATTALERTVQDRLVAAIQELGRFYAPLTHQIEGTSRGLLEATGGFDQVAKQLLANHQTIEAGLDNMVARLDATVRQQGQITAHWDELIHNALHGQEHFNGVAVGALVERFAERPETVTVVTHAAEDLRATADAARAANTESAQCLSALAKTVQDTLTALDEMVAKIDRRTGETVQAALEAHTVTLRNLSDDTHTKLSEAVKAANSGEIGQLAASVRDLKDEINRLPELKTSLDALQRSLGELPKSLQSNVTAKVSQLDSPLRDVCTSVAKLQDSVNKLDEALSRTPAPEDRRMSRDPSALWRVAIPAGAVSSGLLLLGWNVYVLVLWLQRLAGVRP